MEKIIDMIGGVFESGYYWLYNKGLIPNFTRMEWFKIGLIVFIIAFLSLGGMKWIFLMASELFPWFISHVMSSIPK